jgi:5-methylcytosine-specific restriction endonuclease McrA
MVIGIHNYYKMATNVNLDMNSVAFNVKTVIAKRLRKKVKRKGSLENYDYIRKNYGKSKEMRYINKTPLIPVGYVQTKSPINLKRKVNSYTPEGRMEINKKLGVNTQILHTLMREHSQSRSIEYMDNRISLYAGQNGRCAITKKILELGNMQCHHKKPMEFGGTDEYSNLVMLHTDVHILIHAKDVETIEEYVSRIKPDKNQLTIINKFRILANNSKI